MTYFLRILSNLHLELTEGDNGHSSVDSCRDRSRVSLLCAEISGDHLPDHAPNRKRFHIGMLEGYEGASVDDDSKEVDVVALLADLLTLAEGQELEDLGHSIDIGKTEVTEDVSFFVEDLEYAFGLTGINVCY